MIRIKRTGRKNQPRFRVNVTPKQAGGPAGKPKEYLGWFNPFSKAFELKKERISYWLSQGAQPSETMHNLLLKAGVIEGKKIPLHGKEKHPDLPAETPGAPVLSEVERSAAEPPKEKEEVKPEAAPITEPETKEAEEPVPAKAAVQEKPLVPEVPPAAEEVKPEV